MLMRSKIYTCKTIVAIVPLMEWNNIDAVTSLHVQQGARWTQMLYTMGNVPSFDKQSQRGTTNPWRKYGALKKLHEIGGIAPPGNTKGDRKNKDGFVHIKKGSRPPPPPRCAEVTLNKDRRNPGLLGRCVSRRNFKKTIITSDDPSKPYTTPEAKELRHSEPN
ncbi:hypothetical protein ANCDUO_08401 [Ancylostoma duodenale]|uniref:Uncharacterized protein n=1 Tax=Ancylostoma duodenale TaxID=51022 RepID=A0A0C2GW40_9BILA|nr:hypothetical protein ANCDUO_08401 [Ancylostoma duodenale]